MCQSNDSLYEFQCPIVRQDARLSRIFQKSGLLSHCICVMRHPRQFFCDESKINGRFPPITIQFIKNAVMTKHKGLTDSPGKKLNDIGFTECFIACLCRAVLTARAAFRYPHPPFGRPKFFHTNRFFYVFLSVDSKYCAYPGSPKSSTC